MSDEPQDKNLFETIGDEAGKCLPEKLRRNEPFMEGLVELLGFVAGWFVGKKIVELLFGKGDDK